MKSEIPKVAVLLAAYNGMSWIEEQLASIHAQSKVRVHIFISVDPSSDGTEAWCAEHARAHNNVTLLSAGGPFNGAARNFFRLIRDVDLTAFDFIAFSDQDDVWYDDKLSRATSILGTEEYEAYSSNVVAFWPNGRSLLVDKAQPQVEWDYVFEAAGPGCTYVLNRRVASAFKALLLARWEQSQYVSLHDWYCYSFARTSGYKWYIDPVPSMCYRQHSGNQIGVNSGAVSILLRLRKVFSGWWFDQIKLIEYLVGDTQDEGATRPQLESSWSFIKLSLMASKCRRRRRDRWMLAFVFLGAGITGVAGRAGKNFRRGQQNAMGRESR